MKLALLCLLSCASGVMAEQLTEEPQSEVVVANWTSSFAADKDAGSHKLLWNRPIIDPPEYGRSFCMRPVSVGAATYLTATSHATFAGGHSTVYSVNSTTGTTRWARNLDSLSYGFLACCGETLFVDLIYSAGNQYGALAALAKDTGVPKWSHKLPERIDSFTFWSGRPLVFAEKKGYLLDPATGNEISTITLPHRVMVQPLVLGNVLIVGNPGCHAFDLNTGKKLWSFDTKEYVVKDGIAVWKDIIFFGNNPVYALDWHTGKKLWENALEWNVDSAPVCVDGKVIWGAGDIVAFDAVSGKLTWKGPRMGFNPTVVGKLVVFTGTNDITALDSSTGKVRWSFTQKEDFLPTPVSYFDGKLLFGNTAGHVFSLLLEP